ncbi:copper amine oxidase N-terminal domain-containing protein [Paenibacillus swuensis]|uniref:copper amine oxidase N-terminal domain-containing protein n=1 Tax=Paenibacillus swuensis TaxID=1178515 RepID=UPI000839694A|nr:copper amine oxidase N-terminal domain-containing protein [Paenibacillus swuensis]
MMKKTWITLSAAVLAMSVFATSALGAPVEKKDVKKEELKVVVKTNDNDHVKVKPDKVVKVTVDGNVYDTVTSVTYNTYGKGYKGLLKAYVNVQNKPAGAIIAELLKTKYDIDADKVLAEAAAKYETSGKLEIAIDLQKEALQANPGDMKAYKKLAQLNKKLGKAAIRAYVNGLEPKFDTTPMAKNGKVLVPFRAIAEALDAKVIWNSKDNTILVFKGTVKLKLTVNGKVAYINGKKVMLDVPAQAVKSRIVVPIRFVSEGLNSNVTWDHEAQSVIILDKK